MDLLKRNLDENGSILALTEDRFFDGSTDRTRVQLFRGCLPKADKRYSPFATVIAAPADSTT